MEQLATFLVMLTIGIILGAGAFIAGHEYQRWCDRRSDPR